MFQSTPIVIKDKGSLRIKETEIEVMESKFVFKIEVDAELFLVGFTVSSKDHLSAETIGIHLCSESKSSAGRLKLVASSFTGFFSHVLCERGSSVSIENCSFNSCSNSSMLEIRESKFKDCGGSSIEISYKDCEKDENNKVNIKGNRLTNSKSNGIIVIEVDILDLVIESNIILSAKEEGNYIL
jgi:hypothetical protein